MRVTSDNSNKNYKRMKLLSGLVGEVGDIINNLTLTSKEKKQIEADLIAAVCRQEEELKRRLPLSRRRRRATGCSVPGGRSLCWYLQLLY